MRRACSSADGSAYVEFGKNKVLAAVYGPRNAIGTCKSPSKAIVQCKHNASFSVSEEAPRAGPPVGGDIKIVSRL
jgi:exosome complex component RRP41